MDPSGEDVANFVHQINPGDGVAYAIEKFINCSNAFFAFIGLGLAGFFIPLNLLPENPLISFCDLKL